jgi:hypothetical protein
MKPNAMGGRAMALAICCCALPAATNVGQVKPATERDFNCYIQAAEAGMDARKAFLLADSDGALKEQLLRGRVLTVAAVGGNPRKLTGGQVYDWTGSVFIPGVRLDRLVSMLQDYGHRPRYFPETISASKLLCRTGKDHFRYSMRLKEPAVIDVESDVVWNRVDPHRWRLHSYSTAVSEVGKDHGYLRKLYSYWRFAEVEQGVYVEGQTITLSDEFGSMARTFGSMLLGMNPEKSVRHSLASMRESMLNPSLEIPAAPEGLPECGEPVKPGECAR